MNKIVIKLAWVVLALGLIMGCASPQPVEVKMGIAGGSQTLWRYVAQKRGELLQPKGYAVTFLNYPDEGALKEAFLKGQIDVITGLPSMLPSLKKEGADTQYFLPIAWIKDGFPLIVPVSSPVQALSELVGKRIGTLPAAHPAMAYWRAFIVENYGFRWEEKTTLVESPAPYELLTSGQADAAMVDSVTWSQLRGSGGYRVLTSLKDEWQKISSAPRLLMYGGYMARRDWVKSHEKFVEDFIQVNYEALKDYKTNKSVALDVISAYKEGNAPALPREMNEFIATYLGYEDVPAERIFIARSDIDDYQRLFRMLVKAGYLGEEPSSASDFFYQKRG